MLLKIIRRKPQPTYIEGLLYALADTVFGFTLENPVTRLPGDNRPLGYPAGLYGVTVRWSARFQKMMVHVENVPGRAGIEIHGGNTVDGEPWDPTEDDSDGCTLLGKTHVGPGKISTKETDSLVALVQQNTDPKNIKGEGNSRVWSGHSIQVIQT